MTAQELLSAYPHCSAAVAYVELVFCGADLPEEQTGWDMMMEANVGPQEAIDLIVAATKEEVEKADPMGIAAKALPEMSHPTFRTYIAGKMGAA